MYTLRDKVLRFALVSRASLIFLQVIINGAMPDHKSDGFVSPENPLDEEDWFDRIIFGLFGGLRHWDAEYFLHIARYGYTHENCLAFFPLFPLCVRWTALLFSFVVSHMVSYASALFLASVVINFVFSSWAALVLYDLTEKIFRDRCMAYRTAILFCVSPASIFFIAPYSEALFALLTFRGMLEVEDGLKGTVLSSIPFGLAAASRSNGLVNVGFSVHSEARHITEVAMTEGRLAAVFKAISSTWRLLLGVSIMVAPFATFQGYATVKFCIPHSDGSVLPDFLTNYTVDNNLIVPGIGDPPEWCNSSFLTLPYTAVQDRYWNVGFLRYYQWKQIPNFLLALPMAILLLYGSHHFFKQNRLLCYNIGLWNQKYDGRKHSQQNVKQPPPTDDKPVSKAVAFPPEMFVYVAHALCLLVLCFLFIHVQVTTRLLASASPVPYWFAAYFILPISFSKMSKEELKPLTVSKLQEFGLDLQVESSSNLQSVWKVFVITDIQKHSNFVKLSHREKIISKIIQVYFLSYTILGVVLFCNNYPWT
ncbi:GPI mannosyltransferase 2 [Ischnura elegans]|uniref:GPI mannosyltransferase 2 n=1 Tax=Ischnura elegans TaxID=197161 RepID=UPI001ED87CEE|nr:GPI mannosyltransferase 2 [Ischnura elegans]